MPLYTYVVTYRGGSYVAQGKFSNFKGFVTAWTSEVPENAPLDLTAPLRKELSGKAYRGEFVEIPHRKNVWRKVLDIWGNRFVVYAIQTEA